MARPVVAARRYAEAAFQVALRDDQLDGWRDDLAVARRSSAGPTSSRSSPARPSRSSSGWGSCPSCWSAGSGPEALRLVSLLVERGRVRLLPRVAEEYARQLNAHRGVVMATVTSAVPLTADETAAIRSRVEAMAGSAVELRTEVDPGLIGGLTIQVRDRLLDASIRGRLERLRDQLHAGARLR